jgi:hypothetical protein
MLMRCGKAMVDPKDAMSASGWRRNGRSSGRTRTQENRVVPPCEQHLWWERAILKAIVIPIPAPNPPVSRLHRRVRGAGDPAVYADKPTDGPNAREKCRYESRKLARSASRRLVPEFPRWCRRRLPDSFNAYEILSRTAHRFLFQKVGREPRFISPALSFHAKYAPLPHGSGKTSATPPSNRKRVDPSYLAHRSLMPLASPNSNSNANMRVSPKHRE